MSRSRFHELLGSARGHLSSWSRELRIRTEVCYGGCFPSCPWKITLLAAKTELLRSALVASAFFSPKSRLSQLVQLAMTKARQLSPEGGEKCGFFLRGGHALQPQKYSVRRQMLVLSMQGNLRWFLRSFRSILSRKIIRHGSVSRKLLNQSERIKYCRYCHS